jgi:hypothetical protein
MYQTLLARKDLGSGRGSSGRLLISRLSKGKAGRRLAIATILTGANAHNVSVNGA